MAVWQSTFGEASLIKWKYRRKRLYELGLLCLFTGRTEEAFKQAELMGGCPQNVKMSAAGSRRNVCEALHLMALICEFTGERQQAFDYYARLKESGFLNIQADYGCRRM